MSSMRFLKTIVTAVAVAVLAAVPVQAEDAPVTGAVLQQAMYDALIAIEKAGGMEPRASTLFYWNDAEVGRALEAVPNKEKFLAALTGIVAESKAARIAGPGPDALPGVIATATAAYPPNYPDPSTDLDWMLLQPLGLVSNNWSRCAGEPWAYYQAALAGANISLTAAQLACTVAGCDPTGVICASVCGATEIVMAGYLVLKAPVDACKSWDGKLDSAENEAAYRNSAALLSDLSLHDTNVTLFLQSQSNAAADLSAALVAHDLAVKALAGQLDGKLALLQGALSTHDNDIKLRLAEMLSAIVMNQREIIKLLKTPEGRRPGWGKEGY